MTAFRVAGLAILLSAVSTAQSMPPAAGTPRRPDLSFVTDYLGWGLLKRHKSLWEDAVFLSAIRDAIGAERYARMQRDWRAEGRLEMGISHLEAYDAPIFQMDASKPHDVPDHFIHVFIYLGSRPDDPLANTIQVCWRHSLILGKVTVEWLATGRPAKPLPATACATTEENMLKKYDVLSWPEVSGK
jgi:hypothetical protein